MAKRRAYPLEYRQPMVELVQAGRTPEELAREFEPSAGAIRKWVEQAELDSGTRFDGPTTEERRQLRATARGEAAESGAGNPGKSRRPTNASRRCPARESITLPNPTDS